MPVRIYSVFMLFCMHIAALRRAVPPSKESYRLCKDQETEKTGQGPKKGCRTIDG
jgi:hypothetical protein